MRAHPTRSTITASLGLATTLALTPAVLAQSPEGGSPAAPPAGPVTLTLLHNNDGESSLLPITYSVGDARETPIPLAIGGIAAFAAVTDREIADARSRGNSVVNVYAGDAFLAGATLACSLPPQPVDTPIFDAVAQRLLPYDAHVFGNHEFDYGPDFLERFVRTFASDGTPDQPFLSANLDFADEPGWADLVESSGIIDGAPVDGRVVARSAIVRDATTGEAFGIVGATTWTLPTISSPRQVQVTADLAATAAAVQAEIDALETAGIDRIILVSHLQDVDNDKDLVAALRGVDIAVAGGGDELLISDAVDESVQLLPGEAQAPEGGYPTTQTGLDGRDVPIVTTAGNYKYLGRLDVTFDADGTVASIDTATSYPRRVIPDAQDGDQLAELDITDAVTPDAEQLTQVVEPVRACLETFASTAVARSEVVLNVARGNGDPYALGVRSGETNGGNLVADSYVAAYDTYAPTTGLEPRDPSKALVVAVQNGGGIRQGAGNALPNGGDAPGDITRLDTLGVMAFDNYLVTMDLSAADLKTVFERSCETLGGGQFLQVSHLAVTCDISAEVGSRVTDLRYTAGTPETDDDVALVDADGLVQEVDVPVRVITNQFTAAGGDDYPTFAATRPTSLTNASGEPVFYEQALREYLESFPADADGLPTIPATDPRSAQETGEGRITLVLPAPPSPEASPGS
ncbi:MAG: 5'-nucleotidase C-terminal domain-containing protein [Chloroflexi bacterium]|nr:5'-nucleotidase C-terminal domain-containing protein [Chloroflexota bacterium]